MELKEVTNRQYRTCVAAGKCRDNRGTIPENLAAPDLPVVMVTRAEAKNYCAFRGRRLPTEWEWELAARGARGTRFVYGDTFHADAANTAYAKPSVQNAKVFRFSAPAGSFPRDLSGFGILDMGGNVSEWTQNTGEAPVVRGANWYSERGQSHTSYRELVPTADLTSLTIGFRCARGKERK